MSAGRKAVFWVGALFLLSFGGIGIGTASRQEFNVESSIMMGLGITVVISSFIFAILGVTVADFSAEKVERIAVQAKIRQIYNVVLTPDMFSAILLRLAEQVQVAINSEEAFRREYETPAGADREHALLLFKCGLDDCRKATESAVCRFRQTLDFARDRGQVMLRGTTWKEYLESAETSKETMELRVNS